MNTTVTAAPGTAGVDAPTRTDGTTVELPQIRFVRPMPGFPGLTRFALVRLGDGSGDGPATDASGADEGDDGVVFELRSMEAPEVRFLVAVPDAFFPEYAVELDDQACEELSLRSADDALVLVLLTVSGDGASMTANLLAPVVLNARLRIAAQVILSGADWPVRAVVA